MSSPATSSEPDYESLAGRKDGDFAFPVKCSCGNMMRVFVCTTDDNRGRRYVKCPEEEDGAGDGVHQTRKWWDQALEDELQKLKNEMEDEQLINQSSRIEDDPGSRIREKLRSSVCRALDEIHELKARLAANDMEMARLKDSLRQV